MRAKMAPQLKWRRSQTAQEMKTDIDFKDDWSSEMPVESRRDVADVKTVALITSIFQKHLEQRSCPFIADDEQLFSAEILKHVIIVGNFCRDMRLNVDREEGDITIILDLYELTKLQHEHLHTYHSQESQQGTSCACVYWKWFAEKQNADAAKLSEMQMHEIHTPELDCIFNAKFWVDILLADGVDCKRQRITITDVPVQAGKRDYLLNCGFSIDTCVLPLSNIIRFGAYTDRLTREDLSRMIENGLIDCDGIGDCKRKVLRSPNHCSSWIQRHPQSCVFWKSLRMMMGFKFEIDGRLERALQEDFAVWLTPDWFAQSEERSQFMSLLRETLRDYVSTICDIKAMLKVMRRLQFTPQFVQVVRESEVVRHRLSVVVQEWCEHNDADESDRKAIARIFGKHRIALMQKDELERRAMICKLTHRVKTLSDELAQSKRDCETQLQTISDARGQVSRLRRDYETRLQMLKQQLAQERVKHERRVQHLSESKCNTVIECEKQIRVLGALLDCRRK